ncbi:unnamed protein product [Psylliodes chrysocephalus]|uniref:Uncharacterized protein n=1 Tax=Psylliodes chrysocephalus TaxID=3402493 RepID=A0A9P0D8I6_9CUCU|nr:unnamed protein product [Psylliodes chrysocephala]
MNNDKEDPKLLNPESGANFLSRLFFIWTIPFFKKVLNDPSIYSELPALHSDRADILGKKLELFWETEVKLAHCSQRMPILWNALSKIYGNKKRVFDFILLFNYAVMRTLEPEHVFPCSMFLFVALISIFYWIPRSISAYGDSYDTVTSITKLLLIKEVKKVIDASNEKPEVTLERLCFHWSPDDEFDLRAEDIRIKPGSLCLVIGPKNSGKSTLLQLILKEILPRCGKVKVRGSVSYCSQKPWLYSSNIRNNILFGRTYKETRYKNVINTCNLLPDFSQFMNSDFSGVGPEGVILRNDQKCRISLARAVYHEADIYLIDDVLSFMDVEISNKLFDDCFTRYLARKTRVVVSNQLQFLDKADQIIVVHEGRVQIFDNLAKIKDNNIDIYTWIEDEKSQKKKEKVNLELNMDKLEFKKSREDISYYPITVTKYYNSIFEYLKTGQFLILTCLLLITAYVVSTWCDYWLAYWSSKTYIKTVYPTKISSLFSNIIEDPTSPTYHEEVDFKDAQADVLVYISLVISGFLLILLSDGFLLNFFDTAARRLHENLCFSVLRAPMKFFYTNSMAKTFKIFTSDVEIVDRTFPETSKDAVEIFLFSMGCMLLIYITEYIMFFSVIVAVLYIFILHFYLEVTIVLRSLQNTARFPILSHLKETLMDITTIRTHEGEEKSTAQFEKFLDNHTSLHRLNLACMFSFTLWSDLLCNTLLFFTIFGLIIINNCVHPVEPSYAGLAILQVYQLTEILHYGVKKLIQSALSTESINRIIEYSKIPSEQHKKYTDTLEFTTSKSKLSLTSLVQRRLAPENWPEEGIFEFRNVSLTYSNKVLGLDDLNFMIKGHEKETENQGDMSDFCDSQISSEVDWSETTTEFDGNEEISPCKVPRLDLNTTE